MNLIKIALYFQPDLINHQLDQLYLDLELQGHAAHISMGDTSSGGSDEEQDITLANIKGLHLIMIHDDDANTPFSALEV